MNKTLVLFSVLLLCIGVAIAQTNPTPKTTTQKKPPPYVYKKDYDADMQKVNARINSALGTATSVKNEVSGKLDKVDELDTKMAQVEQILSDANIKLRLTSDSLKDTKFSVQAFKEETEKSFASLHDAGKRQQTMLYVVAAVAVLLIVLTFLVMTSRMRGVKNDMHFQMDVLRRKMDEEMEAAQETMKEEVGKMKNRMQDEMSLLRMELLQRMENDSKGVKEQLEAIAARLDSKN